MAHAETSPETTPKQPDLFLATLTARIVSAYLSHQPLDTDDVPALVSSVRVALSTASRGPASNAPPVPAVSIQRSVFPDYIVCLEDGVKLKMLKRHLRNKYDMSTEEYRARWGLPGSYPMVAPNYSRYRSTLASTFGLGHRPATGGPEVSRRPEGGRSRQRKRV